MKRPLSVTSLTVGVLIFTVDNLVRAYETALRWDQLSALPLSVSPIYLAVSGFIWGLAGLVLAVGLWRAKAWSLPGIFALVLVYAAYDAADRLFLARSPVRLASWPFSLGLGLLILILIFWIRSRPAVKAYFGVLHDRQLEDKELTRPQSEKPAGRGDRPD